MWNLLALLLFSSLFGFSISYPTYTNRSNVDGLSARFLFSRSQIAGGRECSPIQREIISLVLAEASHWAANAQSNQVSRPSGWTGMTTSPGDMLRWITQSYARRDEIFRAHFGFYMHQEHTGREAALGQYVNQRFANVQFETWRGNQGMVLLRCDRMGNLGCRDRAWSILNLQDQTAFRLREHLPGLIPIRPHPNQIILVRVVQLHDRLGVVL